MARTSPHFPLAHGVPRVDDRRIVSGIVYVIKHGLQWKDAPKDYGPHKTFYNRFIRWGRLGVFDRIFSVLAGQKRDVPRRIGRTKGRLNSEPHAVCDGKGRPIIMLLSRRPDERS